MLNLSQKVFEYNLPIKVVPQKEGGFVVTSPVWPDCYAEGDSVDEAILEITAVAQSLIGLYKEEGLRVPLKAVTPKSAASLLSVPVIIAA